MPKIIKLGELLPEDFLIELGPGVQYTLPGDPPLELILKIAELFERTENMATSDDEQIGIEVLRELDAEMLRLLRMRDASLDHSPFGVIGVQHVVATILQAYNFAAVEEVDGEDEDPPEASRSPQSSGSRSSSTSSRSRQTTGAGSRGRSSKPGNA